MRILYHHRTQAEDAQGVHIYEMIHAFRELGHEVRIVALVERDVSSGEKSRGGGWERIAAAVPNWVYELLEFGYNLYGFIALVRKVLSFRPDFIYERYSLNTFCGVWISKLFRVPLLLEVNAPLYLEQRKLGKLTFAAFARFSERWICSNASRTIVVTQAMKDIFVEQGVPLSKMVVMHNGINPPRFEDRDGASVRSIYGLQDYTVIGFVGWFRPWHGLEMLVKTFHQYSMNAQGAKLLLVGDGPAAPSIRVYVNENGLENSVILTGEIDKTDIAAHVAAFDIAVQPRATSYACPIKLIEYMAMGKCIIAPDQPNIRELVEHEKSGLLFNVDDEHQLAHGLKCVLESTTLRKRLGAAAKCKVEERGLYWSENAKKSVKLAEELVA